MSQNPNPYAQFGQPVGASAYSGDFIDPAPSRTSIMAIIALVVSIVGCIACILPGPGAIAMVIGGLAVFFIARSSGRLRGMGLAVTAIVLGLLQSIGSVSVITGFSQVSNQFSRKFSGPVGEMFTAMDKGDMAGSRALLTKEASQAITDDMIVEFAAKYQKATGSFQKTPQSLLEIVTMSIELGKSAKTAQARTGKRGPVIQPRGGEPMIPIPTRFSNGSAFVMVVMDPGAAATSSGVPGLVNVGVVAMDGTEMWLLDPDKANKLMHWDSSGGPGTPGAPPAGGPGSTPAPDKPAPDMPAPAKP